MRVLAFPIGGTRVAVPLAVAREVVVEPRVTPLPTAPPWVLGLFDLHGEIVPLFDGAPLLRLPGPSGSGYAVVVGCAQGLAGLATGGPVETAEPAGGAALLDVDALLAPWDGAVELR